MGEAFLGDAGAGWVVIKTVRMDGAPSDELRLRMGREVEAMKRIRSPYVPALVAASLGAARPWFAMEYEEGLTLAGRVKDYGPLPAAELRGFASQLAQALVDVQRAGVVHRDIKPDNILITMTRGLRLLDFGIAAADDSTGITTTGALLGSIAWMAPEQVANGETTYATDVHAWGLVMLYAATGVTPFAANNPAASMQRVLHHVPEVPAGMGAHLDRLVVQALAKDPRQRPRAADIAEVLAGWKIEDDGSDGQQGEGPTGDTPGRGSGRAGRRVVAAGAAVGAVALTVVVVASVLGLNAPTTSGSSATPTAAGAATPATADPTADPSATPSPVGTWAEAKATFADYREGPPGSWSQPVRGGRFGDEEPVAVAVQLADGDLVMHLFDEDGWSAAETLSVPGEDIEAITAQAVDTTGGGGADILVDAVLADGDTTATVLFNFGRFATFSDETSGEEPFVPRLAMLGGLLSDGAGSLYVYQDGEARFELDPVDPWDAASDSFAAYQGGRTGQWSPMIRGSDGRVALAVEGRPREILVHGHDGTAWGEVDSRIHNWSTLTDYEYEAVDVTGQGDEDLLITAVDEEGDEYGSVVIHTGKFARFLEDDQYYPFWPDLAWVDGVLTDATGTEFTYLPEEAAFQADR